MNKTIFNETVTAAMQAADAVLDRKSKVEASIRDEVAGLPGLIAAQLASEREFRRLECKTAIGEPAPGLEKSRKAAADAKAALERASLRLGGLRMYLGEMGSNLVESHNKLAGEIPRHNQRMTETFTAEWQMAVAAWQVALGRRAAIERVLGEPLTLPDPIPEPTQTGEMEKPHETLAAIGAAIKVISDMKKCSERARTPGIYYDPNGVYRLTSDRMASRGWPKGLFVVDASFEAGRLSQLVDFEEARPIADRDQTQGFSDAAIKAAEIEKAAREKKLADDERRLRTPADENLKRSGRAADESYKPTQADLDKAARNRALIDAHVPSVITRGN